MPNKIGFSKETFQNADQTTKDGLLYDALAQLITRMGTNCEMCARRQIQCNEQFNQILTELGREKEKDDLLESSLESLTIGVYGSPGDDDNSLKKRLDAIEKARAYDRGLSIGTGAASGGVFGIIFTWLKSLVS